MVSPNFMSTPMAVRVQRDINDVVGKEGGGMVDVEMTKNGLIVRVKDALGFEFGKARLRPAFKPLLDKIGKIIKKTGSSVIVSGHTDNIPLRKGGKFISNWDLSTGRSVAVVNYWAKRFHIPAAHMSAVGYADGQPLASNDTAKGRSRNRRVEFKIKVRRTASTFKGLSELLKPVVVVPKK
jgi:chemotaxis protein MotB